MGNRWGDEGPPAEAYSRVSDPHRYDGLHDAARELVLALEHRHAVVRTEGTEPDDRSPGGGVVPTLGLVPDDPAAAPVTVVLTSFPGVVVRAGRTAWSAFPSCGCDACDETLDEAVAALTDHVVGIATHGFTERVVRDHGWWHEVTFPSSTGSSSGRGRLEGARRAELGAALPGPGTTWTPWPRRDATTGDLDLHDLAEVQRRVVDPVVRAVFRPGELDSAVVQVDPVSDDGATPLVVVFTDRDGETVQPLTAVGQHRTVASQLVESLADAVEDWISETSYAWGEQRPRPGPGPR